MLLLAVLACSHSPRFPLSGYPADADERLVGPLTSAAYFDRGAQRYQISGGVTRVQARSPFRKGAFSTAVGAIDVTAASDCTLETRPVPTGTVYDALLETEMVVLWDMDVGPNCSLDVATTPPDSIYVLAVGEESIPLPDIAGTGLPILVMFASAWADNYVYGFAAVLFGLVVAGGVLAGMRHAASVAAAAVLATSSFSRAWQSMLASVGGGIVFLAMSLGVSVACMHAAGNRRALLAVLVLTVILPTHSWVDVVAVAVAASLAETTQPAWPTRPVAARIVLVPARF